MRTVLVALAMLSFLACEEQAQQPSPGPGPAQPSPGPAQTAAQEAGTDVSKAGAAAGETAAAALERGGQAVDRAAGVAAGAAAKVDEVGAAAAQQANAAGAAAMEAGAAALEAGARAASAAAGAATGAADQASAAAARLSGGVAASNTAPADFPLSVPSGAQGTFTERTTDGRRTRSAIFRYSGPSEELAARYEKAMADKGLSPEVKKSRLGKNQITTVKAEQGDTEAKAIISTSADGQSQVTILWRDPAP
ncbi:MAG TPA: hypothetical protein VNO33_18855 [Kofleriaceae bacterium]|nr:hypothetical protein [Kofleriaceae bacterium]